MIGMKSRHQIRLETDSALKLMALSDRYGVSVSGLIRWLVDHGIAALAEKLSKDFPDD
jgi:hypothetical protein